MRLGIFAAAGSSMISGPILDINFSAMASLPADWQWWGPVAGTTTLVPGTGLRIQGGNAALYGTEVSLSGDWQLTAYMASFTRQFPSLYLLTSTDRGIQIIRGQGGSGVGYAQRRTSFASAVNVISWTPWAGNYFRWTCIAGTYRAYTSVDEITWTLRHT